MVDSHNKSFFGKSTGIIFDSGPSNSPHVFLTFIKKKKSDIWEKPSLKEGKTVKFQLEDLAFILQVLRREVPEWTTIHFFEGQKTSIGFKWSDAENNLWISVDGYSKVLNYGEVTVFIALLSHVFEEKITTSTASPKKLATPIVAAEPKPEKIPSLVITEEKILFETPQDTKILKGVCKSETEKALLIEFDGLEEIWVPKSTIRSNFDANLTSVQAFEIDEWILKKNNLL